MNTYDRGTNAGIVSVSRSLTHSFSKTVCNDITLLPGLGVEGDAHAGKTVKHRSRVAVDPTQPNLRQVHLVRSELLTELKALGFDVNAGTIGENITTKNIDLLALPRSTKLQIGAEAVIELTGLRNPCKQLDDFQPGLMAATLGRDDKGALILKAGVMGVVVKGGIVKPNDQILISLPELPHEKLRRI